jgi:hypothetical protein
MQDVTNLVALKETGGQMVVATAIGLALMGLSVPGKRVAALISPFAFVAGLGIVVWALFRHVFVMEAFAALVVVCVVAYERSSVDETEPYSFPQMEVAVNGRGSHPAPMDSGFGGYELVELYDMRIHNHSSRAVSVTLKASVRMKPLDDGTPRTPYPLLPYFDAEPSTAPHQARFKGMPINLPPNEGISGTATFAFLTMGGVENVQLVDEPNCQVLNALVVELEDHETGLSHEIVLDRPATGAFEALTITRTGG